MSKLKYLLFYPLEVGGALMITTALLSIPWWVGLIICAIGYCGRISS